MSRAASLHKRPIGAAKIAAQNSSDNLQDIDDLPMQMPRIRKEFIINGRDMTARLDLPETMPSRMRKFAKMVTLVGQCTFSNIDLSVTFSNDYFKKQIATDHDKIDLAFALLAKYRHLLKHRGLDPIKGHYRPLAAMIAAMDADGGTGTNVFAALLSDLVAVDAISLAYVKEKFGRSVERLTQQISNVTRLPITITLPDAERGGWTRDAYNFNQRQFSYAQDTIYGTQDPETVWLIKILSSLQQLRVTHKKQLENKTAAKGSAKPDEGNRESELLARHIMGMYLPMTLGLSAYISRKIRGPDQPACETHDFLGIAEEMQDLLARILDPKGYDAVRKLLVEQNLFDKDGRDIAQGMIEKIRSDMAAVLPRGARLDIRRKAVGSIIEKISNRLWSNACAGEDAGDIYRLARLAPKLDGVEYADYVKAQYVDLIGDNLGVRVVLQNGTPENCREVHQHLIANIFGYCDVRKSKDYYQFPKNNDYRAIHTSLSLDGMFSCERGAALNPVSPTIEIQTLRKEDDEANAGNHEAYKLNLSEATFSAWDALPVVYDHKRFAATTKVLFENMWSRLSRGADTEQKPEAEENSKTLKVYRLCVRGSDSLWGEALHRTNSSLTVSAAVAIGLQREGVPSVNGSDFYGSVSVNGKLYSFEHYKERGTLIDHCDDIVVDVCDASNNALRGSSPAKQRVYEKLSF